MRRPTPQQRNTAWWPALAAGALWAAASLPGCSATAAGAPPGQTTAQPAAAVGLWPVDLVVDQAALLEGRAVDVSGRFAGWSGPCAGSPPRTRSDWMLTGAKGCLYVSGPLPAGVEAPPSRASLGAQLQLRGVLQRADDGRPYLLVTAPAE
jgi:hypothetical protein